MFRLCSLLVVLLEVWHASAGNSNNNANNGKKTDCAAFGISNCNTCNELVEADCNTCPLGYVMNYDPTKKYYVYDSGCTACPDNCAVCVWGKSTTVPECTQCMQGYYMSLATDGTKICSACSDDSLCYSCSWDKTKKAAVCDACVAGSGITLGGLSLTCLNCDTHCKTCMESSIGITTCTACLDGFYLTTDSTCNGCPANCKTCTATQCTVCFAGYILNSDPTKSSCLLCPAECSSCNGIVTTGVIHPGASQCTACNTGYYLDASTNECRECWDSNLAISGCGQCSSSSVCTKCMTGWGLDQSARCTACSYGCLACSFDANGSETCTQCIKYWGPQTDLALGSCTRFPDHCTAINSVGMCKTCETSWAPDDKGVCVPCPDFCPSCKYYANLGATQCVTCDVTTYKSSGLCLSCVLGCDICTDGLSCDVAGCSAGYYPDATSGTQLCSDCTLETGTIPNCLECTDKNTCTLCADGFGLTSGTCTACDTNCAECGADQTQCNTCVDGTVLSGPGASDCVSCNDPNCDSSDLVNNCATGTCSKCAVGYYQDPAPGGKCTLKCIDYCEQCTDGTTCTKCSVGYFYTAPVAGPPAVAASCSLCQDSNCDKCSSATKSGMCTTCAAGYLMNGGSCYPYTCQDPLICLNCATSFNAVSKSVTTTCGSCAASYFKDSTTKKCTPCLPFCTSCSDANTCNTCSPGYGLSTDKTQCSPCPSFCKACTANANNVLVCTACINSYILNKNYCGLCRDNCVDCYNNKGTMWCKTCATGYGLNNADGSCIACPSQCTDCTILPSGKTSCKNSKCNVGFGRSSDGMCVACSSLAFPGCSVCSDALSSGAASCSACANGYILNHWASACYDTSKLKNCLTLGARPYECKRDSCKSPFKWIENGPKKGFCGLSCSACGDIDSDDYREASECQAISANYTKLQIPDGCWVFRKVEGGIAKYARGGTTQYNCTADYSDEVVLSDGTSVVCCSSVDDCNAKLQLDGIGGASAITFSLALLFASILATRLH